MLSAALAKIGLVNVRDEKAASDHDPAFPKIFRVAPAARPLEIAFIYGRMPFPMHRGDQLTVAHWLSYLHARGHKVHLLTLNVGGDDTPRVRQWLDDHCASVRLISHGPREAVIGVVKALLAGRPIQTGLFSSNAQSVALKELVSKTKIDCVYTYYIRSAGPWLALKKGIPDLHGVRSVLGMQLAQVLNARRISRSAPTFAERLLYKLEAFLIERFESRIWRHFDVSILIGEKDREAIAAACRRTGAPEIDNSVLIPHGVDIDDYGTVECEEQSDLVIFSGNLSSHNNISAALWFIEQVWPKVREHRPDARLQLIGRSPVAALREWDGREGIEIVGDVASMSAALAPAAVCVNPMQAGAGMQNKLIEFMASSKAVVATSIANEGIGARHEVDLIVADDPDDFANSVLYLLNDHQGRRRLGAAARSYIERHWTWEAWFERLEAELQAQQPLRIVA